MQFMSSTPQAEVERASSADLLIQTSPMVQVAVSHVSAGTSSEGMPGRVRDASVPPTHLQTNNLNPVVIQWPPIADASATVPTETASTGTGAANSPQGPNRFSFSSTGRRSMVLIPRADAVETRPLYHVSWRDDFWCLDSIVTTVRRGATEDGQLVGEFG